MDLQDIQLFEGKTMADLAKEIYSNTKKKNKDLDKLITKLGNYLETKYDVGSLGITLTEAYKQSISNDDQLLKLASVVQRIVKTETGGTGDLDGMLTQEERDQLFAEAKALAEPK